jgi:hypothetical protein
MDPLITVAQLASRLQSTADEPSATQAITDASGLVRAVARQTFDFVSQETVILAGGEKFLTLPERPLVEDVTNPLALTEIGDYGGIDFTLIENRDFTRVGNELTRGYPWYLTSRLQGWPHRYARGVWAPRVRVTYSHGYVTIPDDVVAIVLDVAQSLYTNPSGLRSWVTPEYSETYATELLGAATVDSLKKRLGVLGHRRGAFSI